METNKEYAEEPEAALREKIIRDMSMDNEKLMPDRTQRHWMAAQAHIVDRDNLLVWKKQKMNNNNIGLIYLNYYRS